MIYLGNGKRRYCLAATALPAMPAFAFAIAKNASST